MKSIIISLFFIVAFQIKSDAQRKINVDISSGLPTLLLADAGENVLSATSTQLGGEPTAVGGIPPYQYQWLPESGLNQADVSNPLWSGTAAITYSVNVIDERGCSATDSVSILFTSFSDPADNIIILYPNPSAGVIRLSRNDLSDLSDATITLLNSAGQVVRSSQWNNYVQDQLFDVSDIANGNYLITVKSKEKVLSKSVIIQK